MEQTNVQKLARVLRVLVLLVLACNLVCLLLVPGIAGLLAQGGPGQLRLWTLGLGQYLSAGTAEGYGVHNVGHMLLFFAGSWQWVWSDASAAAVTLFLWLCGICTAVILWQAKRVLDTILQGNPFQKANARALKRAAVCCFVIAAGGIDLSVGSLLAFSGVLSLQVMNATAGTPEVQLAAAFLTGTFPLYFCKKRYSKQFAIQIKNQEQISNHSGPVISDAAGFFLIGLFNTVLMMKLGYIHK